VRGIALEIATLLLPDIPPEIEIPVAPILGLLPPGVLPPLPTPVPRPISGFGGALSSLSPGCKSGPPAALTLAVRAPSACVGTEPRRDSCSALAERDGAVAYLEYSLTPKVLALVHTEVPEELRGQGIGSSLIESALRWAREHHHKVDVICPVVQDYISKHTEYSDLVLR